MCVKWLIHICPFTCFLANTLRVTVGFLDNWLEDLLATDLTWGILGIPDDLIAMEDCFAVWFSLGCPSNVVLLINLGGSGAAAIQIRLSGFAGCFLLCSTFFHKFAILLSTLVFDDVAELMLDVLPCLDAALDARVTVLPLSLLWRLWFDAEFFMAG